MSLIQEEIKTLGRMTIEGSILSISLTVSQITVILALLKVCNLLRRLTDSVFA